MSIKNRVVVITGATGGLGRVVTKQLADQGARLVLVGTSLERVQSLEEELKLPKERVLISVADFCQPERTSDLVRQTIDKFGRIDILLHLVGGWSGGRSVIQSDCEQVESMLQQHLWTTYHLTRGILPVMLSNHWGRILVVSSPLAANPVANMAPYVIGKAAQETLLRTIADEVKGSGITANILLVKKIDVEHVRDQKPDGENSSWTTPEDIASTLLYLSSDEARTINGARIPLYAS
jgi:NAD(P)-dependent dehydrogenase (short-subunit alcohol dehydrogenase family)